MVALALIGTSALTNTYIKNNDILVTLRDYNGEAKLSDELQELKDLITLTQVHHPIELHRHCYECYHCCPDSYKQVPYPLHNCCEFRLYQTD